MSFSYTPPFMCSVSCHMPKAVGSEIPLDSYCADTKMHESSATHSLNLVLRAKGLNSITKVVADGRSCLSKSHCSPYKWEITGVLWCWDSNSVLCISFHAQLRLPQPVFVTLRQLRESPLMTMHSNLPFLICISWCVAVLVLMLVCAFSAFSPRGRQEWERFYQGLWSSVVDGHCYPQGRNSFCLKRSLWYGKYPNAMVLSIL